MNFPSAGTNYAQERRGIAAIQNYAADTAQIWRETATGDVGIDGQLEYVTEEGFATGKLMAVQAKSGPSFFKHETGLGWKYYPTDKHKSYWEAHPLPVILVLHDPESRKSYWADVRQSLRAPSREEKAFVEVPRCNQLEATSPEELFANAGVIVQPFISESRDVITALITTRSQNASLPISYFDLFVHGLTNICRSIYYGMDLIDEVANYNLEVNKSEFGMGMGGADHEFTFGFVQFLVAQNLAQIDYSDCLIDWVDRQMQPHFVAPLTSRGRQLVKEIHQVESELIGAGKLTSAEPLNVAQEGFFGMEIRSYFQRLPLIRSFQEAY